MSPLMSWLVVLLKGASHQGASLHGPAFVVSIWTFWPLLALAAQTPPGSPLLAARGFDCTFPTVAQADWQADAPKPNVKEQEFGFRIRNVDLKKSTATIVGDPIPGVPADLLSSEISAFQGIGVINFLEMSFSGNLLLTTVFANQAAGRGFKAVHSRHLGGAGAPFPSQSYGFCTSVP
jgi:hypothetical protein